MNFQSTWLTAPGDGFGQTVAIRLLAAN